jgi:hypothetical protein
MWIATGGGGSLGRISYEADWCDLGSAVLDFPDPMRVGLHVPLAEEDAPSGIAPSGLAGSGDAAPHV